MRLTHFRPQKRDIKNQRFTEVWLKKPTWQLLLRSLHCHIANTICHWQVTVALCLVANNVLFSQMPFRYISMSRQNEYRCLKIFQRWAWCGDKQLMISQSGLLDFCIVTAHPAINQSFGGPLGSDSAANKCFAIIICCARWFCSLYHILQQQRWKISWKNLYSLPITSRHQFHPGSTTNTTQMIVS